MNAAHGLLIAGATCAQPTCAFGGSLDRVMRPAKALAICQVSPRPAVFDLDDMICEHAVVASAASGPLTSATGSGNDSLSPCFVLWRLIVWQPDLVGNTSGGQIGMAKHGRMVTKRHVKTRAHG